MKSVNEFLNQMSPVIVVYYADGTIDKVYPVGEKEVKESIASWNQSLYFGEITKFEVVYEYHYKGDKYLGDSIFKYTYAFTVYEEAPEVKTEILKVIR